MRWAWLAWFIPAVGHAEAPCPIWEVITPGHEIAIDFGGTRLTRASLVQQTQDKICPEKSLPVRVLSVNHWYLEKGRRLSEVGAAGCVPLRRLRPAEGKQLVGLGLPPQGSEHTSALAINEYTRSRLGVPGCGDSEVPLRPAMEGIPLTELAHTRVVDRAQLATVQRMGGVLLGQQGEAPTAIQTFSDWGFVSMPVQHELTPEELQRVHQREGFQTTKQKEKSTVAIGARTAEGDVIYTRFLGSDAPRSDRWGTPHTVRSLVGLAHKWFAYCTEVLPESVPSASAQTCPVQFGDLAWYNSRQPDPLGHTTHHLGTCVDIRLFRRDGSRYEAYWNRPDDRPGRGAAYDRSLTGAFLTFVNENLDVETLYFNDPVLISRTPGLQARKGHDDHIHLCVHPIGVGD